MSADEEIQSAASAADLAPGSTVGGYVIDQVIGTGGMGVVYGAHHPRIGKRVAIKVLAPAFCGDPATVARFEQEARLVNEIGHPNIVDAFQFGELPDGRSFFVMEWLEGESLGTRLERGALSAHETIEILEVICDALEAAHDKGVIHRDLKADNVFLTSVRGKRGVKLLDFGLAKLAGRGELNAINKTKSGILVGTPAYMSPEQARGNTIDHRTDIYAMGCLSYKMLTGKLPFVADNAMDLIVQQLHRPPPAPDKLARDTPPVLSRAVLRMMAKSAEDRPTLAELREVFKQAAAAAPAHKPARRRSAVPLLAVVALALVAVLAFGVMKLLDHGDTTAPAATPATAPATAQPKSAAPTPAQVPDPIIEMDPRPAHTAPTAPPITPAASTHSASGSAVIHPRSGPVTSPDPDVPDVAEPSTPKNAPAAILVTLDQPSKITLDGQVVATDSKGGRFDVPAGHHTLEATTPGHKAVTRTIDLDPGGTGVVSITFVATPPSSALEDPGAN